MSLKPFGSATLGDFLFRTPTLGKPAGWYFALKTDAGIEVAGGSYARVSIATGNTNFSTTPDGDATLIATLATVAFPAPTADWGIIAGVSLFDAPSAGNEWAYQPFDTQFPVLSGTGAVVFAPAALTFRLS